MLVISPQQPCGIGRYSLVSGNSPMRASDPTNHLQCLPQSIKVSPRRDEGIPPYRLLALPAAYYKKLCRERLIPVQEPNQRSGWPLKFDCGRSDLPYIFRITLPAKNLSPFYPIRPEKYVDKPRFIWYIIQAIFCGHGPLVKRLRQRPLTPLTWVRFPHGSPKNTPAYAGVFFRVSRARNRTGQCAAAHKKRSSGLFFSPREIPACVTRNTPAYAGVFFRISRARNRTGQCAAAHKKQSSGLFFSPREIPACVTRTTPAYAGVFFRVSRARNRTGQCAAAHKKRSSGLFFSPREIPACVTRNTPAYAGVFFRVSVRGIEPDGAQVLLCAIMERCVFGCILDMKIPPELSEFFLCLL